jgi:iron uptake system EfeUOB component EfeO/EfeM
MAKHTKEGKARNKQLLQSFKNYQARIDQDVTQVQDIIAGALKNNGITEATLDSLATVFRGYEYIKPIAEQAWERYYDHCTNFDYEVQD